LFVAGSYSSALASVPPWFWPPTTRTLPLARRVAVWPDRAAASDPAAVHAPLEGSYSSALASAAAEPPDTWIPPATSTRPSPRTVAVCCSRAAVNAFAAVQLPVRAAPPPPPLVAGVVAATLGCPDGVVWVAGVVGAGVGASVGVGVGLWT